MKLYYSRGACSLAVRIIINELKLPCKYEAVDLKTKQTENGTDFLTINPKGAVPTLETKDGNILTENTVILQYLADTNHATDLLPAVGDFARYRVLEWLNYITTELHKSFTPLFNHALSADIKKTIFIPIIKTKLNFVNKQLTKHYLLGDKFTLPDAYLVVMLNWAMYFKFDLQEWPNLARFHTELKQRSSVQAALEQEQLVKTA